MALSAGRLRHRVRIERPTYTQDPVTGEMVKGWELVPGGDSVPAAIEPLSVSQFMAAQQAQSEVSARIVLRKRSGIDATMRLVHRGQIYNIHGVLPDPVSGLEYMTLPCSQGVNEG